MREETTEQEGDTATAHKKCFFFLNQYGGHCLSCEYPYTPSIAEREQYCFGEDPEQCPHYSVAEAARLTNK